MQLESERGGCCEGMQEVKAAEGFRVSRAWLWAAEENGSKPTVGDAVGRDLGEGWRAAISEGDDRGILADVASGRALLPGVDQARGGQVLGVEGAGRSTTWGSAGYESLLYSPSTQWQAPARQEEGQDGGGPWELEADVPLAQFLEQWCQSLLVEEEG